MNAKPIYIYILYFATTVWRLKCTFPLLYCAATVCHQAGKWFPDKLDQQAATQCSLNSTEMCANAFSKWPLLLYLITQNGVNLNVIVVCHGEAHLARLWERTAAGCLSFAAHLESCSTGLGVRHRQLSWHWLANLPPFAFSFIFFDSVRHDPDKSSATVAVT